MFKRKRLSFSYCDLANMIIADHLERYDPLPKDGLYMVCGPITTGGTESRDLNMQVLDAVINWKLRRGYKVLAQTFYEPFLWEKTEAWKREQAAKILRAMQDMPEGMDRLYCTPILDEYYRVVFRYTHDGIPLIGHPCFLYCWETSVGTTWEKNEFEELGRPSEIISRDEIFEALLAMDMYSDKHIMRIMDLLPPE